MAERGGEPKQLEPMGGELQAGTAGIQRQPEQPDLSGDSGKQVICGHTAAAAD